MAAPAACTVDEFQATTGPRAGFATEDRPAVLAGTWVHNSYLRTGAGLFSSEAVWEFRGDGFAVRTTTLRNIDTGLTDRQVVTGRWGTQGNLVLVALDPPDSGTLRLRFSVQGDRLFLDSREFQRIR